MFGVRTDDRRRRRTPATAAVLAALSVYQHNEMRKKKSVLSKIQNNII